MKMTVSELRTYDTPNGRVIIGGGGLHLDTAIGWWKETEHSWLDDIRLISSLPVTRGRAGQGSIVATLHNFYEVNGYNMCSPVLRAHKVAAVDPQTGTTITTGTLWGIRKALRIDGRAVFRSMWSLRPTRSAATGKLVVFCPLVPVADAGQMMPKRNIRVV